MRTDTVIQPVPGQPGMVAEFSYGRMIGQPFRMPSMAPVAQEVAMPASVRRGDANAQTLSYSIGGTPTAEQNAKLYARPGETLAQTDARMADTADRGRVRGNRVTFGDYPPGHG